MNDDHFNSMSLLLRVIFVIAIAVGIFMVLQETVLLLRDILDFFGGGL